MTFPYQDPRIQSSVCACWSPQLCNIKRILWRQTIFNFDLTRNIVIFFVAKNSWKYCGDKLNRCWQLWFDEKNCVFLLWQKIRENDLPENSSDGKDFPKVASNRHLLVQLRRLSQKSRSFKVGNLEDVGATFGCSRDDFRCMNFDKAFLGQSFSKELADTSL